jgi:hypothetical protein
MDKKTVYNGLTWCDIRMVGEHAIKMKPLPVDRKEIIFIDEDYEDAYWDRDKILKQQYKDLWFKFIPNETLMYKDATLTDEDGFLVSLNTEDSDYIIATYEREMIRRSEGVHIRIGNEIMWITGDFWFVLMWCKTKRPDKKSDFFDYRSYQRDFFYIIHHCNISDHILGCFWSKAKKTGVTNLMWLYFLNKATMTKNINLGNMNIDRDKGAKTFRDHFLYAYNGLIPALRADFKSKSENDGRIVFGNKNSSRKSNRRGSNDEELNSTVMCVATAMNAFDVDVFTDQWYDEGPKVKEDFGAIYRSNSGGTRIQDFIVGKQWITSYTPEVAGISFKACKQIFYDSELKTITPESKGKTKSMLICHHIPAYDSWATSFDKYGECNGADAKAKIQAERDSLKDRPQEYLKKVREYANTKKEAWSVADSSSVFDPLRLAGLEFDLEEEQRATQTFVEGRLEWVNPVWEAGKKDQRPKGIFDRVRFIPLTEEEKRSGKKAKLRIYNMPHISEQNLPLQQGRDEWGNVLPPAKFKEVGGIDPADFRDVGNFEEGSLIGMYSMSVHDPALNALRRKVCTKTITCEYYERPDSPIEWYEDIVKHIIFFGCLSIIEGNNATIATKIEDEGLGYYMLFKDVNNVITTYRANHNRTLKHIKNANSGNTNTISDLIMYIASYLLEGNPVSGDIDYGATIKSERLLKQLKEFDPNDTKKFDLVMSFGYTVMAHEIYMAIMNKPDQSLYRISEVNAVLSALFS